MLRTKKDKNVLYLIDERNSLGIENETFIIKDTNNNKIFQIPIIKIDTVIVHGYISVSNKVIYKCADNNIELVFLNHYGQFKARIIGKTVGNIELRLRQFRIHNSDTESLEIAKCIIKGKTINQLGVLQRALRSYNYDLDIQEKFYRSISMLELSIVNIQICTSLNSLRGIEGKNSEIYFGLFDYLIVKQKENFTFNRRSRMPPLDRVNSMLSYLYVILASEVASSLYTVGLDPYIGFMHSIKSGKESLALDLMEELRLFMVDRLVLSLINKNQIHKEHFQDEQNNGVYLNDIGKKEVLKAWEERKRNEVIHPYFKEKVTYGMIPYYQAVILARYIRGDISEYVPYKWS